MEEGIRGPEHPREGSFLSHRRQALGHFLVSLGIHQEPGAETCAKFPFLAP